VNPIVRLTVCASILLLISGSLSSAWNPGEALQDPVLEARARALSANLRCLVCQNQSIDDSDADLARDLRILVRERIAAGDTDDQVIDYLVDRYGEFVLLKPRLGTSTYLLWGLPFAALAGGAIAVAVATRARRNRKTAADMTEAEKARLASILDQH
jgi:cytochrome c-type biogenesis protein CcmH